MRGFLDKVWPYIRGPFGWLVQKVSENPKTALSVIAVQAVALFIAVLF